MSPRQWKVATVSVAGFSHKADNTPCQDAHAIDITNSGWLIAAVSDGAGSATRSSEGSRLLADSVVAHLSANLRHIEDTSTPSPDANLAQRWIEDGIDAARNRLSKLAGTSDSSITDFHATLLGVVVGPEWGIFFHIGDGAGCATFLANISIGIVSGPENGEYSDETYFATEDRWRDHLRLTHFSSQYDMIALMSDGVTPFALSKGALAPFPPFFDPLSKFLAENSREDGERATAALLEREAIRPITGDDKTLIWALRIQPLA